MSRPVRPRPVDIFKKLPIIRSSKDLEDEEITGTRASQSARLSLEIENESNSTATKKNGNEIPTPQFVVVDSYERDYARTFNQPSSYVRAKVRTESSDYVEYDLDDEDEDWLQDFDKEKTHLTTELFEISLYKLEIMDHKARERAMGSVATSGPIVSVMLQFDHAAELLQSYGCKPFVLQAMYNYWKEKREKWQKPILRRLQPPPPVNDANPYTVFRPREKTHRLHTRRMQRRENSVQSFEKLRQVRRNLEQAKAVIKALVKREEKKKELLECEVELQRVHVKLKHETQHEDDVFTLPGLSLPHKFAVTKRGEEDRSALQLGSSLEIVNGHARRPGPAQISPVTDSMTILDKSDPVKRDARRTLSLRKGQVRKRDVDEPVLWFAKPLDPEKLALAGINPPADPISPNDNTGTPLYRCRARMGRGGRVVFDRWDPLERIPLGISWSAKNGTTHEAIN